MSSETWIATLKMGILFIVGIAIYFLPYFVARRRQHVKRDLIFILNLFLGGTLIGWIVLMVWSLKGESKQSLQGDLI